MCDDNAFLHPLDACDGKVDPISEQPIGQGQGFCMNGRCYSIETILNFSNNLITGDPITRRPFSERQINVLRLFGYFDIYLDDYVNYVACLAQHFALLRQLRAALLLFQMRHASQGEYPVEISDCEHQIQVYRRRLRIRANLINSTVRATNDTEAYPDYLKTIIYDIVNKIHIYHIKNIETYMPWIEDINLSINSKEKVGNFLDGYLRFVQGNENEPFNPGSVFNMDNDHSISMNNYDDMIALNFAS